MRCQTFPAARRIRRRGEFAAVYASGKKYHSAHYLLVALVKGAEPQRLGLSVSRKVGNAVARNRARRILREFFRLAPFCIAGAQLVVVAKAGAADLDFAGASVEMGELFCRAAGIAQAASYGWGR